MVQTRKKTAESSKKDEPPKVQQPAKPKKSASPEPAPKAKKSAKVPTKRKRSPSQSPSPPPPVQQAPPAPVAIPQPVPPPSKVPEEKTVKAIKKGRGVVDAECPKSKDCHVYEEPVKVWAATLNQADLKDNANKFYIIQLLQNDSKNNEFYVWNRWGRVGYSGQSALKGPFNDVERAKSEFNNKFRDKTKGGYIEVLITYDEEEEPQTTKKAIREETKKEDSKLDTRVKQLIDLIFDLKTISNTLAEIGYDAKKMPLGKLSVATIKQGMEVLKEIETELQNARPGNNNLSSLSSKFYSLIPHDFGFKHMSQFVINTNDKLKEKVVMLENLADMKIANNILENSNTNLNPADEHYLKLKCGISAIERDDPLFTLLETYVKNTHAKTHNSYGLTVMHIFKLDKEGEDERFRKDLHNRMLLWHGSRLTNWVGILSQGLRIAPPEAPVSGYMFGKGVYFADMVSKSANYCFTSRANNTGILLLCDVALGNCNEKLYADFNAAMLPTDKHSTKGCGRTAPLENSYVDLDGMKVPIGEGQQIPINGSLLYNEYIVYDVKQIRMKYLFIMRFDYRI